MAKGGNRGLPSTWRIDVPKDVLAPPVSIGDYLDDDIGAPPPRTIATNAPRKTLPQMQQAALPSREVRTAPTPFMPQAATLSETIEVEEEAAPAPRQTFRPVARKQVNMNGETLRMVEELLDQIQRYSRQKDTKASEMFHGLVSAIYEARELLDFSNVQARGKWGTPTARAFPVALKNAFQQAIADWRQRTRG